MDSVLLYNTLSGKKEEFKPLTKGQVLLYSCGPTVYDYAHIGNFRSFLFADLLFRVLRYAGYEVIKAQNITDVGHLTNDDMADADGEDKITKKAKQEHRTPFEIARGFEDAFIEDEAVLRILPPTHRPRATDYIPQQIKLTQKLIQEGYAYESNGSVYFATRKFKSYGKLSKNNIEDLVSGARVEIHSDKKDPLDFALWKKADESHIMQWKSPWGPGFPGWHLECSAMSQELLGNEFDIHTGGEDNIFPHHECEIAQNEGSNGGKKSVNYWLHVKHLQVDGHKMSKSAGNFYTIRDLIAKGWKGEEIRFALLKSHYKTSMNFSEEGLEEARKNIKKIRDIYKKCKEFANTGEKATDGFVFDKTLQYKQGLFDDFNTPIALSFVYEVIGKDIGKISAKEILYFLETDFDPIFDILTEETQNTLTDKQFAEIEKMIDKRFEARENKDWAKSDELRDTIQNTFGVELKDKNGTTTWQMK